MRLSRAGAVLVTLVLASCDSAVEPILPVATTIVLEATAVTFSSLGETDQITASVLDQEGGAMAAAQLTWVSSNESVATVSSDGTATAVGNGTTTVMVRSGAASGSVTVTVRQIGTMLTLSSDSADFTSLGDTVRLGALVQDAGGSEVTDAVVDWLALDTTVAVASTDGLVTAVANGTTLIAVTSSALLATVSVSVSQAADSIELSVASLAFDALGDTTRLVANVWDAGGSVFNGAPLTWTSSDSAVAAVSADGLVTSVDNGTAVITADAGGVTFVTAIDVAQIVADVSLLPDSLVFGDIGESAVLVPTARDRLGAEVLAPTLVWSSADDGIATVASGLVTSVATGTVAISVDASGVVASISARVVPELTLLLVSPDTVSAEVATQVALSARVEDLLGAAYEGATVSWGVDSGAGTIVSSTETTSDGSGHVNAVWALGTGAGDQQAWASISTRGATVVVSFVAGAFAAPAATAFLFADSVLLSGTGETVFLAPSFLDAYGNTATAVAVGWSSTDDAVATVAPDGLVTGQAAGSAYIKASLGAPTDSILVTLVQRGGITITFDDGWDEVYDHAWSRMQARGLKGNVGVITGAVDGVFAPAPYMNLARIQALHDDGWTMVSHTVNHPQLDTLTPAQLTYELQASKQWLDNRGFGRGSNIFIAPFHVFNDPEKVAASAYYTAARGTSANAFPGDSLVFWQPSLPYELTGIDMDQLDYTVPANRAHLETMLQRTIDEGRFIDVMFHHVDPAKLTDFEATLDIIALFIDRVLPYHELYPQFARSVF